MFKKIACVLLSLLMMSFVTIPAMASYGNSRSYDNFCNYCDDCLDWNEIFMEALGFSTLEELAMHIRKFGPISLPDTSSDYVNKPLCRVPPPMTCCTHPMVHAHGPTNTLLLTGSRVTTWLYTCWNCRFGLAAIDLSGRCICRQVNWRGNGFFSMIKDS